MITYVVKQGDTLESIARAHGFLRWQTLYNHPANAAFRAARPDPGRLSPGDRIVIPDRPDAQRRPPIRELAPFEPHREVIRFSYSRLAYFMAEGVGIHGSFRVQGYAIVAGPAPGRWSLDVILNMTTGASNLGSVAFSGEVQLIVDGRGGPRRALDVPRGPSIRATDVYVLDLEDPFPIPERFQRIELSVLVIPVFKAPEGRALPMMRLAPERVLILDAQPGAERARAQSR